MDKKATVVPAGEFKQKCLAIIDTVATTHEPVVISKRGKPVARLVPVESDADIEATGGRRASRSATNPIG